ncbi:hypothetical protein HQ520_11130 [bacterium]|nr:hypothetical protein [bacterium]
MPFALVLAIIVLLVGSMVSYEQGRRVSWPLRAEVESTAPGISSTVPIPESRASLFLADGASSTATVVPAFTGDLGFLDPADFSEDLADLVREINEEYKEMLSKLAAYRAIENDLSYEEAKQNLLGMAGFHLQDLCYKSPGTEKYRSQLARVVTVWCRLRERAFLDLYEKHDQWREAANLCRINGLGWDAEVYYYRKGGAPGRIVLTHRVLERVKRSILTIGPNFRPPWMVDSRDGQVMLLR